MSLLRVNCHTQSDWLVRTVNALRTAGYMIVEGVLDAAFIAQTRDHMYAARDRIQSDVGTERLTRAGELGVLRNLMKYDEFFLKFLALPQMLQVVDATVSATAILHLQNGFILPSFPPGEVPRTFQNKFHMDFPRVVNGYLASINALFAIDEFTSKNGGTLAVPGTQQQAVAPDLAYLEQAAAPVECPTGSMLVFDSTLWHAAGANVSGKDRLAMNHQFTRSFIKQQVDYVRALGDACVERQPPRTQQLLGWYTRVVTSLDDYYRPEEERLYRRGQG